MSSYRPDGAEYIEKPLASAFVVILLQFLLQAVIGIALESTYRANVVQAHASVAGMHAGGALMWLQRFHYWDSALLIGECGLLVAGLLWTGSYQGKVRPAFTGAGLLFLAAMGFQLTGNVLPFDLHGVETVNIEAGIAARIPYLGQTARDLALGGPSFGEKTLQLAHAAHVGLILLFGVASLLVFLAKRQGAFREVGRRMVAVGLLLPFAICLAIPSPFGTGAVAANFDDFGARASWYTWPLHGALTMFDRIHAGWDWIGAILIPGLLVAWVLLFPWVWPSFSKKAARGVLGAMAVFFLSAGVFFGGAFASLTGTRDPAASAVGGGVVAKVDPVSAAAGRKLFDEQGCGGCHGKDGLAGGAGPSLKTEFKKHPDAAFYEKYIHNPASVDPQSTMPAFASLTPGQLAQIADFLRAPRR